MHRVFQTYIDRLTESTDLETLHAAVADATAAFDLHRFAYLSVPRTGVTEAPIVSNYPPEWTTHYQRSHYERLDPVIVRALRDSRPFTWGRSMAGGPVDGRNAVLSATTSALR